MSAKQVGELYLKRIGRRYQVGGPVLRWSGSLRNGLLWALLVPGALWCSFALAPSAALCLDLWHLQLLWEESYNPEPESVWGFGQAISTAGDLNADGYDDVVIGGRIFRAGIWIGKAYIFFGGSPMDTSLDLELTGQIGGQIPYDGFGRRVSAAGDFNSDGYDDVMVGAPNADDHWGRVYIYYGGPSLDTTADLMLRGQPSGSGGLGLALSPAGDVNGDGHHDLVLGAFSANPPTGRACIFFGGPDPDSFPDVMLEGHGPERFGIRVGGGGDANGDDFSDVIVGAWQNSEAAPEAGKVYVYFGGNPMDTVADVWLRGEGAGHCLGWQGVSLSTDLDGDGFDDAFCGTSFWPYGFPANAPGKLYILLGGVAMDTIPDIWMVGKTDSSMLGHRSCGLKDTNGDGCGDLLCTAVGENFDSGAVYLWLGDSPMDTTADAHCLDYGSGCVSSAGDVDGDGLDEVMFSNGFNNVGGRQVVWICKYTETGVEEEVEARRKKQAARLFQNQPNPFWEFTIINYRLPRSEHTRLAIYDVSGRLVRVLVNEEQRPGDYSLIWDGKDVAGHPAAAGIYFYRLTVYPALRPEAQGRGKQRRGAGDPALSEVEVPALPFGPALQSRGLQDRGKALRIEGSGAEVPALTGVEVPVPSHVEVFTATKKMVVLR